MKWTLTGKGGAGRVRAGHHAGVGGWGLPGLPRVRPGFILPRPGSLVRQEHRPHGVLAEGGEGPAPPGETRAWGGHSGGWGWRNPLRR